MRKQAANAVTGALLSVFSHPWHIMGLSMLGQMIWLAIVYARPEDTFARSSTYRLMGEIATEEHWAMAFGACAILRGVAFIWRRGWFITCANCCCSFILMLCTVCFFWAGGLGSSGAGLYAVMSCQALVVTLRRVFLNASGCAA